MKDQVRFRPAVAFAAFVVLLAASAPVRAYQPYGGGLTVMGEQWPSRTFKTVFDSADVIKSSIDHAWAAQTDPICNMVKAYAMQPGLLPNGISVLSVTCNFGPSGSLFIDASHLGQDVVGLRYVVPGNSIVLTTSKPAPDAGTVAAGILTGGATAVAEGAADNPEFSIDFGIVADVTAGVQNMSLTISSAVAKLDNVHFNSRNFLAAVGLALQPSIRTEVEDAVKKQQVDLKQQVSNSLALISAAFAPAKDAGYTRIEASYGSDHLLLRLVGKTYDVATTGPGRISGGVYFTATSGQPNPAGLCAAMSVQAVTPNSFNDVSQFNVTSTVPVGQVGAVTGGPVPGERYACYYTVASVPVGVPITIQVHVPPSGAGLGALSPVGWSGTVTLPGFGTESRAGFVGGATYATTRPQPPARQPMTSPQVVSAVHPVTTLRRTGMQAPPPVVAFAVPQPAVAGNTASNMNFTLGWQALPR